MNSPNPKRTRCVDHRLSKILGVLVAAFLFVAPIRIVSGQDANENLREIIDRYFVDDSPQPLQASDSEFARRVSIDLTAMPLSADDLRAFLADKRPDKRERLVQKLVGSPHFERRMATFLDVMLMERRVYKDIKEPQWQRYLLDSVRANKPWNKLAQEILSADGVDEKTRAAVRFYLDRGAEPNLLTRDIGRIFFGKDLQCAQCHDHPLVDDYLQSDYQGMLAFLAPGYVKTISKPGPKTKDGKPGKPVSVKIYAEKDGNDIQFESVFVKDTKHRTGPRLIGKKSMLEPDLLPAVGTTPNRPQHSRRNLMAIHATDGSNSSFNENIANRLWGMVMGRGLVHPPDFHHRDNPPTHPALMKRLGEEMVALQFDMKKFVTEITLSRVYQRSFDVPPVGSSISGIKNKLRSKEERKQKLEQQIVAVTEQYEKATTAWAQAESRHIPVAVEVEKLRKAFATSAGQVAKLKTAMESAKVQYEKQREVRELMIQTAETFKQASATLPDQEVAQLNQQIMKKLEKIQSSTKSLVGKATAAEKKFSDSRANVTKAELALGKGYEKRKPFREEFDKTEGQVRELRSSLESLMSRRTAIESELATLEKIIAYDQLLKKMAATPTDGSGTWESLAQEKSRIERSVTIRLARNHVVSSLRPLSPEQYCWSMLKVTGFYQRYFAIEEGKLRKAQSLATDAELTLDQRRIVEEKTYAVLKGHLNNFVRFYAAGAGQPQGDFFATADQALFAANGGNVNSYVNPANGNVTDRMLKASDNKEAAEALYLAILSRMPSLEEQLDVDNYLKSKADNRREAVIELAWSLLNSAEFRFNH